MESEGETRAALSLTEQTAEQCPDASTTDEASLIEEHLAQLRCLIERDAVEEARARVKELERRWPQSERVRRWARVLAPPEVSVSKARAARSLHRERSWLREHAREHPGCWVAVFEDRLIAADPDLRTVLATTRRVLGTQSALLHYEPPPTTADGGEPALPR